MIDTLNTQETDKTEELPGVIKSGLGWGVQEQMTFELGI